MSWIHKAGDHVDRVVADVTGETRRDLERRLKSVRMVHDGVIAHAQALLPAVAEALKTADPAVSNPALKAVADFTQFIISALENDETENNGSSEPQAPVPPPAPVPPVKPAAPAASTPL
jgi:hypothetical protein